MPIDAIVIEERQPAVENGGERVISQIIQKAIKEQQSVFVLGVNSTFILNGKIVSRDEFFRAQPR